LNAAPAGAEARPPSGPTGAAARRRSLIGGLLVLAVAAAAIVVIVLRGAPTGPVLARGQPIPTFAGTTLTGGQFDLAAERGHPVIINFWGPSCVPCREEMPLLAAKAAQHAASGVVIVGVLTDDPVEPAKAFAAQYGGSWDTVIDPDQSIKRTYQIVGRPQTFFVDANGIYRDYQVGPLSDADFERKLAEIAGG
jgi:thiol-disulfide isomerase/thioredoxin